jgi:hypothetical protein
MVCFNLANFLEMNALANARRLDRSADEVLALKINTLQAIAIRAIKDSKLSGDEDRSTQQNLPT